MLLKPTEHSENLEISQLLSPVAKKWEFAQIIYLH